MSKGQQTGLAGTHLVAAELLKRGLNAVVTSRNMKGTDILVEDPKGGHLLSVQVKCNRSSFSFWLAGDPQTEASTAGRFFVLVNIRRDRNEFFVLPARDAVSRIVTEKRRTGSIWHSIYIKDVEAYQDRWDLIEQALAR